MIKNCGSTIGVSSSSCPVREKGRKSTRFTWMWQKEKGRNMVASVRINESGGKTEEGRQGGRSEERSKERDGMSACSSGKSIGE